MNPKAYLFLGAILGCVVYNILVTKAYAQDAAARAQSTARQMYIQSDTATNAANAALDAAIRATEKEEALERRLAKGGT